MNNCCKNTDKEIWRQTHEDYYSPSIHVTEQGTIGIKCGGHVIVATVQDWHNWGKEALLDAVDLDAEPPRPTPQQSAQIPWRLCGMAEAKQYRSRVLTGSIRLESSWCNWIDGKPDRLAIHREYEYRTAPQTALMICVPWVEQGKHWTCDGCHHEHSAAESQRCAACRDYDDINDAGQVYHRFWTPAQPEPDAPVNRPCSTCGWMVGGLCGCTIACDGDQWKPRKPKAAPGLVKYDIKKTNEHIGDLAQWICPFGYLPDLAGFVDFDHIELKSGATVTTLGAFPKDDPPVRAWFCVANNSRSS